MIAERNFAKQVPNNGFASELDEALLITRTGTGGNENDPLQETRIR